MLPDTPTPSPSQPKAPLPLNIVVSSPPSTITPIATTITFVAPLLAVPFCQLLMLLYTPTLSLAELNHGTPSLANGPIGGTVS